MDYYLAFKNFVKNNKFPLFIVFLGFGAPIGVSWYIKNQTDRLNTGIYKDLDRIKASGRKLSDYPKSKD